MIKHKNDEHHFVSLLKQNTTYTGGAQKEDTDQ